MQVPQHNEDHNEQNNDRYDGYEEVGVASPECDLASWKRLFQFLTPFLDALFAALYALLPTLLQRLHPLLLGIRTRFQLLHASPHGAVVALGLLLIRIVAGRRWLGQSRFCTWYSTTPNAWFL